MDTVISQDGTPIAFARSGSGPSLVLVHGATSDHSMPWKFVRPTLEEHFTVYAMDRRGRGASGDGPVYALDREAEDIAVLVNSLNQPVNLLGHSYGGLCAIRAALITDNIRRMILYEGVPLKGSDLYKPGLIEKLADLIDAGEVEDALVTMFREVVNMPDDEIRFLKSQPNWERRISNARTAPREMQAEAMFEFEPSVYERITIPTLLLVGGESPPRELAHAQTIASSLPNCRIQILSGQQHAAMYTSPELFARAVIEFFSQDYQ